MTTSIRQHIRGSEPHHTVWDSFDPQDGSALLTRTITQAELAAALALGSVTYPEDCDRICAVAKREMGLELTRLEADVIWTEFSHDRCASWLIVRDEEIPIAIRLFVITQLQRAPHSTEEPPA